jgi:hypothetical protein
MQRQFVVLRINRNRLNPQLRRRPENPNGNLRPIGNQKALETFHQLPYWISLMKLKHKQHRQESGSFSEEKEPKRLLLFWATGCGDTTPNVP